MLLVVLDDTTHGHEMLEVFSDPIAIVRADRADSGRECTRRTWASAASGSRTRPLRELRARV